MKETTRTAILIRITWLCGLLAIHLPSQAQANDEGDAALRAGQYEDAIAFYQQELDQGANSAALHFNLGLAHAHFNNLGLAVFHMTQASFLDPSDSGIEDSLALVQRELERQRTEEEAVGESITSGQHKELLWLKLFHRIPSTTTELAIIVASWLAFGFWFLRRSINPSVKRDAVTLVSILSFVVLTAGLAYRVGADLTERRTVPAVVTSDEPTLRTAPDREARRSRHPDLFDGAVVLIRDQRDEWIEVELPDGTRGFLAAAAVQTIEVD